MSDEPPKIAALLTKANWHDERKALRALLLSCGLEEAVKWNKLCYTLDGKNVAIIFCLKDYCGIGFFKGSLIQDPQGLLHRQGEHSQATRLLRYKDAAEIAVRADVTKAYIREAMAVERAGLSVDFKEKHQLVYPEELQARLDADPALKAAFEALTPGRKRGYNLHFSGARQSKTRTARIEKAVPCILAGKGMNER